MYLKHLQIINYKNLKQVHFNFSEGTNTIIGENDSGKSNAMQALRILLDDTYYYSVKRLKGTLDNYISSIFRN
jgi:predicted ATP-dependent endonuclease of OLD family